MYVYLIRTRGSKIHVRLSPMIACFIDVITGTESEKLWQLHLSASQANHSDVIDVILDWDIELICIFSIIYKLWLVTVYLHSLYKSKSPPRETSTKRVTSPSRQHVLKRQNQQKQQMQILSGHVLGTFLKVHFHSRPPEWKRACGDKLPKAWNSNKT